jgi:hypothetical protein
MTAQRSQAQAQDPRVLIEQAIARTGSVEKAAVETGEPLRKVQAVYDAMLRQ